MVTHPSRSGPPNTSVLELGSHHPMPGVTGRQEKGGVSFLLSLSSGPICSCEGPQKEPRFHLPPEGDTALPLLYLHHEGSHRNPLPRGFHPGEAGGLGTHRWACHGDLRSMARLTFQSSTASNRKMRIPTSRLMAMIQPTT